MHGVRKNSHANGVARRIQSLLFASAAVGLGVPTFGASTWTGGASASAPGSGNWSVAGDWTPIGVPPSSVTTELDFLGTGSYISTDDLAGVFNLNLLKLNGSGGSIAALSGDSLAFNGSSPAIQQIGAGIFNISTPVNFTTTTSITQVNGGEIDFNGNLSGTGAVRITNSSGSGSSTVKFTGANSFSGLTINSHVTAVSAPSSNTSTLGSGIVTLSGGTLQLQGHEPAPGVASEQAIGLSGFTGDTIADPGANGGSASSNGTPLNVIDGGNLLFVSGLQGDTNGVPANGLIKSPLASQANFRLGYNGITTDFADKNVLYFTSKTAESLAVTTPVKATSLQFLLQAQNATSFDVQFNFSDGSTSTYTNAISTANWASFSPNNNSNTAFSEPDVLNAGGGIFGNFYAKLSESDLTLNATDAAKTITGIQFTPDSVSGSAGFGASAEIYAVSGLVTGVGPFFLPTQTFSNAVSVTADSSIDVSGSLSASMGNLTIGSNRLSITSSDPSLLGYSLTFGATTLTGNASIDVAPSNGGGFGTVILGALNDTGTARTITFNPAGSGMINLSSGATSLVTGTTINIAGGTLNSNNATALGTTATVNVAAPATLVLGASQVVSALNGAGSVNLSGNQLTVGSTDNLSSNFSGTITGSGAIIANTTGSITLAGSSTFTGATINNENGSLTGSVLVKANSTVVVAGASNVTRGGVVLSGPLGTGNVLAEAGATLLLDSTPGRSFGNTIYATSTGATATTIGAQNITGVSTYSGNVFLGSGTSGDNSHNAILGTAGGGELDFTGTISNNSTTGYNSSVAISRLSGSGTATVRFTGNNAYSGGTTVNANSILAVGPTSNLSTLGSGSVTLAGGTLSLRGQLPTGSQQEIPVSGYNAATIVDAAASDGTATSEGYPTSPLGNGLVYFENGYQGNTTNGLPNGGAITSLAAGHHQFQLGTYSEFNTARMTNSNPTAQLTFNTPGTFQTIDLLAIAEGGANMDVTLNFADGTSDDLGQFGVANWYGGGNAFKGLDPAQIDANGSPSTVIYDGVHDTPDNPHQQNYNGILSLGEIDVTIPAADQSQTIAGLTFTSNSIMGTSADVYAVSGATSVVSSPLATQSYANALTITADSGIDVGVSLNASIGALTIGNNKLTITSSDTSGKAYILSTGPVTFVSSSATFDVENSASGGVGTLILGSLNDMGAAQNLIKLGPGTLALNSAATSISQPSSYSIQAGTLAANNPNALTANGGYVGLTIGAGATFSLGAPQTVESINDFNSPAVNSSHVVLNGNGLTVGARDQSAIFSGTITDGTTTGGSLTKTGIGSLALRGSSTYTGGTTVGLGTLIVANTTGSATGSGNVTLSPGAVTLASGSVGTISGNIIAGAQTFLQPGGNGSIGTLTIGGLNTDFNTDLNFDLGTGATAGPITNGDLLKITGSTFNIASDTLVTFNGSPNAGDYRLIGGPTVGNTNLANFDLPTAPSGTTYSLSNSVDPGYIDLVVVGGGGGTVGLIWTGAADGTTWDNGSETNWLNGQTPSAFTSGNAVTFNDTNNNGHYTVNLGSNVLPAAITVTTANTYNINSASGFAIGDGPAGPTPLAVSGGGTLNLNVTANITGATTISGTGTTLHLTSIASLASGTITVGAGSNFALDGVLTGSPAVNNSGKIVIGVSNSSNNQLGGILDRTFGSLTIGTGASVVVNAATTTANRTAIISGSLTNNGSIGLGNNDLVVRSTPLGTVSTTGSIPNQIASGFNNGAWNGSTGISSVSAASNTTHLTALGYATGGGSLANFDGVSTTAADILVKYTYFGDATLDGKVDGSDYTKIDSGFITHATGWSNGDFNYDGVINGSDYTLIDNSFNRQGSRIAAELANPSAAVSSQLGSGAVPEPASLSLLSFAAAGLLGRRRSRH